MILTKSQLVFFKTNGWLITDPLNVQQTTQLAKWVSLVQNWSDNGGWLNHYEMTDHGPQRCRTEYFTPYHEGLRTLLLDGSMLATAGELLGEPAVLYKEKINFKLAGGAGWDPHQDAPAYPLINRHVSCMIAIDDTTIENGCLEVVSGMHHELIPTDIRGCVPKEVAETLTWTSVPLKAGQTLWFHSLTPHRSGDNHSSTNRRAIYPTYNAESEGDLREQYYAIKRAELQSHEINGRVQISLIDDFRGIPVPK